VALRMGRDLRFELSSRLCRLFGAEYAVLFGRARSAVVAAIEEITPLDAPVVIPSNTCSALLAAVVAAERQPVLAAVSADTGIVDDRTLVKVIQRYGRQPGMILITHLFGMLQDYPMTEIAARQAGWCILENDSLAATAIAKSARVASRIGLLVSFGTGKFLDGGGGGAIMTNDAGLAAALTWRAAEWPVFDDAAELVEKHIVLARRHLTALGIPGACEPILTVEATQCRHSFDARLCEGILSAIDAIPIEYARRKERLKAWHAGLAAARGELDIPPIPAQAPWRAIFRASGARLRYRIVAALRGAGFDAGTNYPPLWDSAPRLLDVQRRHSGDVWGASVLALWLSDAYDRSRIQCAADLIKMTIVAEKQDERCQ
jgi:hypothetical protein